MSTDGKVSVLVKSRRVPVRTLSLQRPIYLPSGLMVGSQLQRVVVYGTALDPSQAQAIKEGKRLSCSLDLDFEVIDSSKASPFRRLFMRLSGAGPQPSLILVPNTAAPSS